LLSLHISFHPMAHMFALAFLLAPFLCGDAARTHREARAAGRVSHLFTFGAPHPSNPTLTRKDGGCFAGYRITNQDDDWLLDDEDIVPTLLTPSKYDHPNVQTIVVAGNRNGAPKHKWSCGSNPFRVTRVSAILHLPGRYLSNMGALGDQYSRAKIASAVGLKNSYEGDLSTIKKDLAPMGWRLVSSALVGKEDVSHLMQEESSLRCILTFEGSDSFNDWITDAKIIRVPFCGLPMRAHLGFKSELMRLVSGTQWQANIRPKLGKCSSVDAVGHSLGGAVASLFTACVDFQNGSEDYQNMSWSVQAPQLMSSV
jgi:hypothetical protein